MIETPLNQRRFYTFDLKWHSVRGYFYIDGQRIVKKICDFNDVGLTVDNFNDQRKLKLTSNQKDRLNRKIMTFYLRRSKDLEREVKKTKLPRIKALFQEWIDLSAARRSPSTVNRHYIPTSNDYMALVGDHVLDLFDVRKVDKFTIGLEKKGLKPVSINTRLRSLRTFINWAMEREPKFTPKLKWKNCFLDEFKKPPGILTGKEFKALVGRISDLIKETNDKRQKRYYLCHQRYVFMATGTGCRLSEIFYLKWDQIDLDSSRMTITQVDDFTPKSKAQSVRFLPPFLVEYLGSQRDPAETWYLDDGHGNLPYKKPSALTTAFYRHFKELGIKGVKATHGFRAGFATMLRNRSKEDLKTIQHMMGLSSPKVLDHYFSELETPLISAAKNLDPFA
jgi:integrase